METNENKQNNELQEVENNVEKITENAPEEGNKKITEKPFWKKHFLKLFLVLLVIVSFFWGFINNQMTIKNHKKEIAALKENHENEINKLQQEEAKKVISTLAFSVRSEMIAENMNQVNQYFLQSLKNLDVERVLLVNQNSGKVILSTNKKDEENLFEIKKLLTAKEATIYEAGGEKWFVATPIMGLNTQLGVLIMEVK